MEEKTVGVMGAVGGSGASRGSEIVPRSGPQHPLARRLRLHFAIPDFDINISPDKPKKELAWERCILYKLATGYRGEKRR